jgi:hypothetical protein
MPQDTCVEPVTIALQAVPLIQLPSRRVAFA